MTLLGLAVGGGTGPELAAVFRRAVAALAAPGSVEILPCERRFKTYHELSWDRVSAAENARASREDAAAYEAFLASAATAGARAVFRTAFNAQSLYLVRERLTGVKIEALKTPEGELLLARDEAQGFYAGDNDEGSPDEIRRPAVFSRATTTRLLDFAVDAATRRWKSAPQRIVCVYKHHLLDNRLARWVFEHAAARGWKVELVQPDTMNRELLRSAPRGRVLVLGANEWLDAMHADLLARFGGLVQEERFTRNHYLDARLGGMVEYQTVHGSADDIAGKGAVNPLATLRAAAAMLEEAAGIAGAIGRLESAAARARADGRATPDAGGRESTDALADRLLAACAAAR